MSALMWASETKEKEAEVKVAEENRRKVVELLLAANADVNSKADVSSIHIYYIYRQNKGMIHS